MSCLDLFDAPTVQDQGQDDQDGQLSCLSLFENAEIEIDPAADAADQEGLGSAVGLFDEDQDELLATETSPEKEKKEIGVLETPQQVEPRRGQRGVTNKRKLNNSASGGLSRNSGGTSVEIRRASLSNVRNARWSSGSDGARDGHDPGHKLYDGAILSRTNLDEAFQDETLEKVDAIAAALWSSDITRGAAKHSAQHFGVTEYFLRTLERRLAALGVKAQDHFCHGVLEKMRQACEDQPVPVLPVQGQQPRLRISPQLFLRVRQYDETPIRLRVATKSSSEALVQQPLLPLCQQQQQQPLEFDVQTAKLFLTEQRCSALYRVDTPDGQCHYFQMEANLITPLQALHSNSALVMANALDISISKPWDAMANHTFKRVCSVVTTDDLGANKACERLLGELDHERYPDATWTWDRGHGAGTMSTHLFIGGLYFNSLFIHHSYCSYL